MVFWGRIRCSRLLLGARRLDCAIKKRIEGGAEGTHLVGVEVVKEQCACAVHLDRVRAAQALATGITHGGHGTARIHITAALFREAAAFEHGHDAGHPRGRETAGGGDLVHPQFPGLRLVQGEQNGKLRQGQAGGVHEVLIEDRRQFGVELHQRTPQGVFVGREVFHIPSIASLLKQGNRAYYLIAQAST